MTGDLPVGDAPENITSMSIVIMAIGDSNSGIKFCCMNASILYRK